MHPLFIAHLVADFLLQPTWLVRMKKRRIRGVVIHALIHLGVMGILLTPLQPKAAWSIFFISMLHAVIDQAKITVQRRQNGFARDFLLDQLAHLFVMTISATLIPPALPLWRSVNGTVLLGILAFFSFGISCLHLVHNCPQQLKTKRAVVDRLLLLGTTFLLFLIPAVLII